MAHRDQPLLDIQEAVDGIQKRVRARIPDQEARSTEFEAAPAIYVRIELRRVQESVRRARAAQGLVGQMPPRPPGLRPLIGAALVRLARRILFWYTPQIRHFQSAAAESLNALEAALTSLERQVAALAELVESPRGRLAMREPYAPPPTTALGPRHELDILYADLQSLLRGPRDEIKSRLNVYIPRLKDAGAGGPEAPVLDIGCGRGEWLEVLKESGLQHSRGIDINRAIVARCQASGLPVSEAEGIAHLKTLPAKSLGAVTALHVLEHLTFPQIVELLKETARVLKPGGLAIFETPNPDNILVRTQTFHLDPTHQRQLPGALLKFLAEDAGLSGVEALNLHPYPESYHFAGDKQGIGQRLNEILYGPRDYAILGRA